MKSELNVLKQSVFTYFLLKHNLGRNRIPEHKQPALQILSHPLSHNKNHIITRNSISAIMKDWHFLLKRQQGQSEGSGCAFSSHRMQFHSSCTASGSNVLKEPIIKAKYVKEHSGNFQHMQDWLINKI